VTKREFSPTNTTPITRDSSDKSNPMNPSRTLAVPFKERSTEMLDGQEPGPRKKRLHLEGAVSKDADVGSFFEGEGEHHVWRELISKMASSLGMRKERPSKKRDTSGKKNPQLFHPPDGTPSKTGKARAAGKEKVSAQENLSTWQNTQFEHQRGKKSFGSRGEHHGEVVWLSERVGEEKPHRGNAGSS